MRFLAIISRHIKGGGGSSDKPATGAGKVGGQEQREKEELIVNYSNGTDPFLEVETR